MSADKSQEKKLKIKKKETRGIVVINDQNKKISAYLLPESCTRVPISNAAWPNVLRIILQREPPRRGAGVQGPMQRAPLTKVH